MSGIIHVSITGLSVTGLPDMGRWPVLETPILCPPACAGELTWLSVQRRVKFHQKELLGVKAIWTKSCARGEGWALWASKQVKSGCEQAGVDMANHSLRVLTA